MPSDIVEATQSFVGSIDGEELDVRKGDIFEADHPAVSRWPENFAPVQFRFPVKRKVEQATAAPGEKRRR